MKLWRRAEDREERRRADDRDDLRFDARPESPPEDRDERRLEDLVGIVFVTIGTSNYLWVVPEYVIVFDFGYTLISR